MAGRVGVVDQHLGERAVPRDLVRAAGQRHEPGDEGVVVAGGLALGAGDQGGAVPLRSGHGCRGGVPGDVAERGSTARGPSADGWKGRPAGPCPRAVPGRRPRPPALAAGPYFRN